MTSDDDMAAESLVRAVADGGAATAGRACPEPNLLAGFAERSLSGIEAEAVAAHASACAACRTALADLAGAGVMPESREGVAAPLSLGAYRARTRWFARPRAYAAAALVLVAVGAGLWALGRDRAGEPPPDGDARQVVDARLVAAARDLGAKHPEQFLRFVPLSAAERAADAGGRERGGLRLLAPSDVVLHGWPKFRWVAVPGVSRYEVRLAREGGPTLLTRTVEDTSLAFPSDVNALEPGAPYVWTVAVEPVLGGRTEARRTFAVAPKALAGDLEAVSRALGSAPEDLRLLLAAHWALRHELVGEAEQLARAHVERFPADAVGRETLRHVLLRQGSPEAEAWDERAPGAR
jgi:hypothetical protein